MKQFKAIYCWDNNQKSYTFLFPDDANLGDIYYDRDKDNYVQVVNDDRKEYDFTIRELNEKVLDSAEYVKKVRYGEDTKEDFYKIRKAGNETANR